MFDHISKTLHCCSWVLVGSQAIFLAMIAYQQVGDYTYINM